jgi:hypothetical protein
MTEASTASYDFDLHGIVGIRLLGATRADLATVARQLGPLRADLGRDPDLTIRFVDRLTTEPLTYVGLGDTGYNRDGFFVLRGKGGVPAKALVPFADLGHQPQIVCERAMPSVPHLLAVINLIALGKGVLPLHASAFTIGELGVLVTGWAKSGKTESLLAAMGAGGRYVGDEWVYLAPDGRMFGLPEPIRLWSWHLDQLPEILGARPREERMRLAAWKTAAAVARTGATSRLPGSGIVRRGAPVIARQAYLQIPPEELFGADRVVLQGPLDSVVLVHSHAAPEIVTGEAGPTEVSGRMLASLADERAMFMTHHRQFRYAFPGHQTKDVDAAPEREARLLSALFDGRPAATVAHPYPCDIAELGDAVLSAAREVARPPTAPREVEAS